MLAHALDALTDDTSANFCSLEAVQFMEEKGDVGMWSWDIKNKKMEWSHGLFRLLGQDPASARPLHALLEAVVHPEDQRDAAGIELLMEGGSVESEFRVVLGSGGVRWIRNRGEVLFDQTGAPIKAIGVMADVSGLHHALSRAESFHKRYSNLIEAIQAVIWFVRAEGLPGDLQRWCKLTGQTAVEADGNGWLNAIHADDQDAAKRAWSAALSKRGPCDFECRLRLVSGAYRWCRLHAMPIFKSEHAVREWMGVCIDIHPEKAASLLDGKFPLTGAQLRAARGILNWSVRDLAETAEVSASCVRRLEETDGPLMASERAIEPLRNTLDRAGIEFLFPFVGKPGVRPR